ncbi:MAG: IclR family transcriptional regulator [Firmicutes bacterium]|nr:IclR family transcriptional regulator [Bacillota bacterium]
MISNKPNKYHVSTIQRAVDVLNLFRESEKLSFTQMLDSLEYSKSTLFRVLHTLEENRYLSRDKHGWYELGTSIFVLGNRVSQANQLKKVAGPHMKKLSWENNLAVHLGILDRLEVIILDKCDPPNNIKMVSRAGATVPAHCTGQGKTLLAYSSLNVIKTIVSKYGLTRYTENTIVTLPALLKELEKIKERGYALDKSEHERHIRCVCLPILNQNNQIEAAISMTGLVAEFPDEEAMVQKVGVIQETRDRIRRDLGFI